MRTNAEPTFALGADGPRLARFSFELSGTLLALLALVLFAANAVLHFPGTMNNDSINQYREAVSGRYTDWHPPVMAALWSVLHRIAEGPAPFLLLHLALYWTGFALVGDGLRRSGRPGLALLVVLAGAFPPFLYINAQIVKDVGMAAAWLAAVGLLFWFRVQGRRLGVAGGLAVAVLLAYGTLVRGNAVFGLGPLLLYALAPASWLRSTRLMVAAVVVAVLAIPASQLVNRGLFNAKAVHPEHSLFMFDLTGIAVHAGDPAVLAPRATLNSAELRSCYTPYWWDPLSPWGPCGAKVHRPDPDLAANGDGLAKQWVGSILEHPVAYATHRLKHFNSSLLFLVPPKHIRLTPEYRTDNPARPPMEVVTERDVKLDIVRKNFLIWPVTWAAWAIVLLVFLHREAPAGPVALARVLAVSALGYSGAYLVIGVATDMRYHYWSLLAVLLATLVVLPRLWEGWRQRSRSLLTGLVLVGLVIAAGTATRLLDIRGLV